MLCSLVQAQEFPEVIDLGTLDGIDGFRLDGEKLGDYSGVSVRAAGDVNGDGIDDLILGADRANPGGTTEKGRSYVLFGSSDGFPVDSRLSELDGSNGFMIDGEAREDRSGGSVAGIGDFNGDDIDDIIIGAPDADPNGNGSGRSYVIYGSISGFGSPLPLNGLDGSNGFMINGEAKDDLSGYSVAAAGNINNDGFMDVIIGAKNASPDGLFRAGRSYVVFGGPSGLNSLQLADLDGANGFKVTGERGGDNSGSSVAIAGDVNDDEYDDVIIGAPNADPDFTFNGRAYVVFGKAAGFDANLSLANLNGQNGFRLEGTPKSEAGYSVSGAGDVNGDRIADLIIGAPGASPNGTDSGSAFVVFGTSAGFPRVLDLGSLGVSEGFRLDGESSFDAAGTSVRGAGDINGDGIDDVIIGAPNANPVDGNSGRIYVVFGSRDGFPVALQLRDLDGTNGFKLNGENDGDSAGISVSAAGDVNGDGRPDLIIGAYGHDANGNPDSGRSYVVFGRGTPSSGGEPIGEMPFVDGFEVGG